MLKKIPESIINQAKNMHFFSQFIKNLRKFLRKLIEDLSEINNNNKKKRNETKQSPL